MYPGAPNSPCRVSLAVALLLGLAASSSVGAAEKNAPHVWAGFRGDGSGATPAKLPREWSAKKNVAWVKDLPGYGQSAPVVWKDRVFVTGVEGPEKDRYHVAAFELTDGKILWQKTFAASQKAKSSSMISRAAPTPLADADAVYAFLEGGDVVALSHKGDLLWQRSLVKDYGEFKNNHGLGSSLAGTKNAVVVLVDHQGPSYLLALDKKSGNNLWKIDRASRSSWSSPVVVEQGGRERVLVSSGGSVDLYDAVNGELLVRKEGLEGNNIPSATALGSLLVLGASEGRMAKEVGGAARTNCCLELIEKDGKTTLEARWQAKKVLASMASPLVYKGHVYFVNRTGVVTCLNLDDGAECYSERLDEACWASPIAAGEFIFFFGKSGVTTVVKAGPKFEKVADNELFSPSGDAPKAVEGKGAGYGDLANVVYGVAAVEGRWLIRTGERLYCIANETMKKE